MLGGRAASYGLARYKRDLKETVIGETILVETIRRASVMGSYVAVDWAQDRALR